jgi:hypothetical protein
MKASRTFGAVTLLLGLAAAAAMAQDNPVRAAIDRRLAQPPATYYDLARPNLPPLPFCPDPTAIQIPGTNGEIYYISSDDEASLLSDATLQSLSSGFQLPPPATNSNTNVWTDPWAPRDSQWFWFNFRVPSTTSNVQPNVAACCSATVSGGLRDGTDMPYGAYIDCAHGVNHKQWDWNWTNSTPICDNDNVVVIWATPANTNYSIFDALDATVYAASWPCGPCTHTDHGYQSSADCMAAYKINFTCTTNQQCNITVKLYQVGLCDWPPGSGHLDIHPLGMLGNQLAVALTTVVVGQTYNILSTQDLASGVWTLEMTVTADSDPYILAVPANGRQSLFLRASVAD